MSDPKIVFKSDVPEEALNSLAMHLLEELERLIESDIGKEEFEHTTKTPVIENVIIESVLFFLRFCRHEFFYRLPAVNKGQNFVFEYGKIIFKPAAMHQFYVRNQIGVFVKILPCLLIQSPFDSFVNLQAVPVLYPQ